MIFLICFLQTSGETSEGDETGISEKHLETPRKSQIQSHTGKTCFRIDHVVVVLFCLHFITLMGSGGKSPFD